MLVGQVTNRVISQLSKTQSVVEWMKYCSGQSYLHNIVLIKPAKYFSNRHYTTTDDERTHCDGTHMHCLPDMVSQVQSKNNDDAFQEN